MLLNSMGKLGAVIVDKPGDKLKHIYGYICFLTLNNVHIYYKYK
jgi:hypothetical protein